MFVIYRPNENCVYPMTSSNAFSRAPMLSQLDPGKTWDLLVIGGGATGVGTALDAASRGYSTILLEQHDFAKGTSSRSTKLVHGGVRYLAQGNIKLVVGALHERGILLRNAPHVVKPLAFIIPCYSFWSKVKYAVGLKFYDLLSGRYTFGKSEWFNRKKIVETFPNINSKNLLGGVQYFDGQFDDARLAIDIARSAAENGATLLNYVRVGGLIKESEKITGVEATDVLTGKKYTIHAKVVVNATGIFVDDVLHMDDPAKRPVVTTSQGIHIVIDKKFLASPCALMIPETSDGRVVFAVPWHDHLIIGTTDNLLTAQDPLEPQAREAEIDFLLESLRPYLVQPPARTDILSVYAGLRPLAAPSSANTATKEISRSHKITVSRSGLITVIGGKWTTYRKMAQDAVDAAIPVAMLTAKRSVTENIHLHGYAKSKASSHLDVYGADAKNILALAAAEPSLQNLVAEGHPYSLAEVAWAIREEMAMTVEDVLARRLRLLFTDAAAAMRAAPAVADLMMKELHLTAEWKNQQLHDFERTARNYIIH